MRIVKDKLGNRYGKLIVIAKSDKKYRGCIYYWICKCDCGNTTVVRGNHLRLGGVRSCGCIKGARPKHNQARKGSVTPTYTAWVTMKARCLNKKCKDYKNYGGRGIRLCEKWINSFKNFFIDMGEKPDGLTLDRKDNNGNYTPSNCRWATVKEQNRNKRGVRLSMEKASQIREMYCGGQSITLIAIKFDMNSSSIHDVINNRAWI